MRFGNLLNELLMEYWNSNAFKGEDLLLSVADDSPNYFVFTVTYLKTNKIIGTFTVTTHEQTKNNGSGTYQRAMVLHKFKDVPNKQVMLQAYGLFPEVITTYMASFGDSEEKPQSIRINPNTPVEVRIFKGSDFDALMYGIAHGNNTNGPLRGYYRKIIDGDGAVEFYKMGGY